MSQANTFSFTLEKTVGKSRAGYFETPHGKVQTPIFMPVGTVATVKALDSRDLVEADAEIILANTYHLYLRPGAERLAASNGLHHFMNWQRPVLTDSGGFQVFSLGDNVKISESGVAFKSHMDGSSHFFHPEDAIEMQRQIGADIIMAFDECTPDKATPAYAREALNRTHRWAKQCVEYWESKNRQSAYGSYQALFGIVQGALIPELRQESANFMASLPFDGIAVGGETVGYNMPGTAEVMSWIESLLPEDKPRYAMGLGRDPQNIVDAVQMGFDMFDCVAPTRLARNGTLYFGELAGKTPNLTFETPYSNGRLQIGRREFATDQQVIQPGCDCSTCQAGYSRAYLHHLLKMGELSYYRLASIHNVRFMVRLSQQVRQRILDA
jgi:queuine tRNA-ribosyltransferase